MFLYSLVLPNPPICICCNYHCQYGSEDNFGNVKFITSAMVPKPQRKASLWKKAAVPKKPRGQKKPPFPKSTVPAKKPQRPPKPKIVSLNTSPNQLLLQKEGPGRRKPVLYLRPRTPLPFNRWINNRALPSFHVHRMHSQCSITLICLNISMYSSQRQLRMLLPINTTTLLLLLYGCWISNLSILWNILHRHLFCIFFLFRSLQLRTFPRFIIYCILYGLH